MANENARLIFSKGVPKKIGSVQIDAFISEVHTKESTPTRFPVEDGTNISDHVIVAPDGLQINGLIGAAILTSGSEFGNRALDGFNELSLLLKNKETVTVVTGLKVYTNMIIENFVCNRDSRSGGSLPFSMRLTEIRIVNSQLTTIPKTQLAGDEDTQLQSQAPVDVGKTTSGQTQEDEWLAGIQEDVDELFANFE